MSERWILHVDLDAFFAAVEELDNPRLVGKPVIVGGTPQGHGVVSTANYIARKYGVHSAMPAAQAVRLCPHGVFVRPRPDRYAELSRRVLGIFRQLSPLVEPLSIDEAFLDVTGCRPLRSDLPRNASSMSPAASALAIASEIQARVENETGGLTCSVGIAENKFLAKIASDLKKPGGLVVVPRGGAREFLAPLRIERLWGVGPRTAAQLHAAGFHTVADIAVARLSVLQQCLGVELARHLHGLSHGRDQRPVTSDGEAKSISNETTFAEFIPAGDIERIENILFSLSHRVAERLRHARLWGRTLSLKVRDNRFATATRSQTVAAPMQLVEEIFALARRLFLEKISLQNRSVRLLGVAVSNLVDERMVQLRLFDEEGPRRDQAARLAKIEDEVRSRVGQGAITRARLVRKRPR